MVQPNRRPSPVSPASQQSRWRVKLPNESEFGPLTGEELKELVRHKILTADCFLQREGKPEWMTARQVFPKTFTPLSTVIVSPPPPPPPLPPPQPIAVQNSTRFAPIGGTTNIPAIDPPVSASNEAPIVAEVIAEPLPVVSSQASGSTAPKSTSEYAGMALVVALGFLILFAGCGLLFTFADQQGWRAPVAPKEVPFVARTGFGVVLLKGLLLLLGGLASLGAFLGRAAFSSEEERRKL